MFKLQRTARFYFLMLKRLRGDPDSLARGVALGVFIGITPTVPLHTISIIALSFPLRASKISGLLAAILVSNPLTIIPSYYYSWKIGDLLLPGILSKEKFEAIKLSISSGNGFVETISHMANLGLDAITVLLLGGCLLAIPFTVVCYLFSLNFFRVIEEKRIKRQTFKRENEQPD